LTFLLDKHQSQGSGQPLLPSQFWFTLLRTVIERPRQSCWWIQHTTINLCWIQLMQLVH